MLGLHPSFAFFMTCLSIACLCYIPVAFIFDKVKKHRAKRKIFSEIIDKIKRYTRSNTKKRRKQVKIKTYLFYPLYTQNYTEINFYKPFRN